MNAKDAREIYLMVDKENRKNAFEHAKEIVKDIYPLISEAAKKGDSCIAYDKKHIQVPTFSGSVMKEAVANVLEKEGYSVESSMTEFMWINWGEELEKD